MAISESDLPATGKSKVDTTNRVTVPREIRDAAGIDKGDELKFLYRDGELELYKIDD